MGNAFFWILYAAAVILFFYLKERLDRCTLKGVILKTAVSVIFVAAGTTAALGAELTGTGRVTAVFVICGFVAGLAGDIWLDLKFVFKEKDRGLTCAGFISFSIEHILIVTGMIIRYGPGVNIFFIVVPFAVAAAAGFVNVSFEKKLGYDYGCMRGMVILYGMIILSVLLTAGSLCAARGWKESSLVLIFTGGDIFCFFGYSSFRNIF